jgi:hypothetical protein
MYKDFHAVDRWTKKEVHCIYQALIVAIATRHADAVDIKFMVDGRPVAHGEVDYRCAGGGDCGTLSQERIGIRSRRGTGNVLPDGETDTSASRRGSRRDSRVSANRIARSVHTV